MTVSWKGATWAALVAGAAFMILQMLLVAWLTGASPWGPPRLIAAMVMGSDVAPPPAGFELAVMTVAMLVHFAVSLAFAIILGSLISLTGADLTWAVIGGAVFGVLLYLVNFYAFTAVFPWFAQGRSAITMFAHIVYGGALGGVYRAVSAPMELPPTQ